MEGRIMNINHLLHKSFSSGTKNVLYEYRQDIIDTFITHKDIKANFLGIDTLTSKCIPLDCVMYYNSNENVNSILNKQPNNNLLLVGSPDPSIRKEDLDIILSRHIGNGSKIFCIGFDSDSLEKWRVPEGYGQFINLGCPELPTHEKDACKYDLLIINIQQNPQLNEIAAKLQQQMSCNIVNRQPHDIDSYAEVAQMHKAILNLESPAYNLINVACTRPSISQHETNNFESVYTTKLSDIDIIQQCKKVVSKNKDDLDSECNFDKIKMLSMNSWENFVEQIKNMIG